MATITLGGNAIETNGTLPQKGAPAPDFTLTNTAMADVRLADFKGQKLVLNIFPSIDTNVCASSVRKFNVEAAALENTQVLNISRDLPFAHKRFCGAEGINNCVSLAEYKNHNFGNDYGVAITTGAFAGLLSRAVVVINENGEVVYSEQVPEIGQEPNYEAALQAVKA